MVISYALYTCITEYTLSNPVLTGHEKIQNSDQNGSNHFTNQICSSFHHEDAGITARDMKEFAHFLQLNSVSYN
jgi:hypothetical protein